MNHPIGQGSRRGARGLERGDPPPLVEKRRPRRELERGVGPVEDGLERLVHRLDDDGAHVAAAAVAARRRRRHDEEGEADAAA